MTENRKPVIDRADAQTTTERTADRMTDEREREKLGRAPVSHAGYIPGYHEQKKANDIAKGERFASGNKQHGLTETDKKEYYERFGTEPGPVPYEFDWARTRKPDGTEGTTLAMNRVKMRLEREGWKPAKERDFEEGGKFHELGWELPPGADVAADGTIRRWDTTLMYLPRERFERVKRDRQRDGKGNEWAQKNLPGAHSVYEQEEGGEKAISYPQ